jgi:uncharacterized membrane protein YagU involved in acid resistance
MREALRQGAVPGALAGLAGGVAFGVTMVDLGTLESIATIARAESGSALGWLVHMAIAAIVGAAYGMLVRRQRLGVGETLFWGLSYGAFFWFLGPLTLRPVLTGGSLGWSFEAAQRAFPALLGHLVYGAAVGIAYAILRQVAARGSWRPAIGAATVARGVACGLAAAAFFGPTLGGPHALAAATGVGGGAAGWGAALGYGAAAGVLYVLLTPPTRGAAGPSLVRGLAYGFLLWVMAAMAIFPAIDGRGLPWTIDEARDGFTTLPAHLLFGVAIAVLAHWAAALGRLLFEDDPRTHAREAAGGQAARALGRGLLAGLIGGALFTPIWLHVDYFPNVAGLVGGESTGLGVFLHFLIAETIGAAYGLLFRRHTFDLGSGLGYGLAYGVFWWVLGVLTLLPEFLGAPLRWEAELAAGAFPGLVGHLVYGAALGIALQALEARHNPWWIVRTDAEAQRRQRSREQVLTSAPALWALVVLVALAIPLLVASPEPAGPQYGEQAGQGAGEP